MKAKEMRDKTLDELEATYSDTRKELFQLVNEMQRSKKIDKPHLLRQKRKNIARLLTVITEKQSAKQNSTL
jgi:large subunit ribosomal protein L29